MERPAEFATFATAIGLLKSRFACKATLPIRYGYGRLSGPVISVALPRPNRVPNFSCGRENDPCFENAIFNCQSLNFD